MSVSFRSLPFNMYLTLNSQDSITNFSTTINPFDFTIELGTNISLNGDYECALVDVSYKLVYGERRSSLLIFCDLVDSGYIRGKFLPLLRIVDRRENFSLPYYKKLTRSQFNKIRIYILDLNLDSPSVQIDSFTCTLHLRKVAEQ